MVVQTKRNVNTAMVHLNIASIQIFIRDTLANSVHNAIIKIVTFTIHKMKEEKITINSILTYLETEEDVSEDKIHTYFFI